MRRLSKRSNKTVKRFFGQSLYREYKKDFSYQINLRAKQRRVRPNSQRGIL